MPAHATIQKSRSKRKPFKVTLIAENGEPLMTPQLLTTRRNCIKNLLATMKAFHGDYISVNDFSSKSVVQFELYRDGAEISVNKKG